MPKNSLVPASEVINNICRVLDYSRAHVSKKLRDRPGAFKAKRIKRRWFIPQAKVSAFIKHVADTSGRRYKLGETGPHA